LSIPRIYIACLAAYNSGYLHGSWVDLDGSEDLNERLDEILNSSPMPDAEEWAVHDHEYCGRLSEYPELISLHDIIEAYQKCEAHHIDWEAFVAFCEYQGEDLNTEQIEAFENAYAGCDNSLEDWCTNLLEETGQLKSIPENLRFYFNYRAFADDMEINDVFTIEHNAEVLVFWRC